MNKKIALPTDVEYITATIFHSLKCYSQFKYMNFIYSIHIEHFIDIEIFLAIWHEVMSMHEEDLPTCKLGKLGNPTREGRGGELC